MSESGATSGLLALARTSLLTGGNATASIQDILAKSPGFGFLQKFFSTWLKLDITTLAAVLTIFGTLSGGLKDLHGVALKVYWWITKFFTASISIASSDRLNREVINWLGARILTRQGTRILTACSEKIRNDSWSYFRKTSLERNDYQDQKRIPVQYLPTFGTTWFIHERRIFMVRRIPTDSRTADHVPDEYAAAPMGDEPLVVMCLGRSVEPIKRFLNTCRDFADKQRESFITIRASKQEYSRESWDTTILRPIRPLETVHFDEAIKQEIVDDITNYLNPNTRLWHVKCGIPYRRGYLLHGPPGTGKTSLSLALAGHFGLELYLLHIPGVREDSELEVLFAALPPRCLVLLEDIDAVGMKRRDPFDDDDEEDDDEKDKYSHSRSRCTLSGLLNVLDGVASQEGRIVLMTSNFADKLDRALVRPGRIDRMIFLGNISRRSAELMFHRMYTPARLQDRSPLELGTAPETPDAELREMALKFSVQLPEDTFTPAQVQGYLLNNRTNPAKAVAGAAAWAEEEKKIMEETRRRAKEAAERKSKRKKDAKIQLQINMNKLAGEAKAAAGEEANVKDEVTEMGEPQINGDTEKEKNGTVVAGEAVTTETKSSS
jgi:mitochondrial chaperone BCS1